MLEVKNVTKKFESLIAVNDCTLRVEEKSVMGLIGPNGSGKTTLLNVINGFYKPDKGHVFFNSERIDGLKVSKIAQMGIGRTFQITSLFRRMTVMENLIVAGLMINGNREQLDIKAMELLKFFGLYELRDELAENISGGQQKLLELGRALILDPKLLLLDEPFHAIHPNFKEKIMQTIRTFSREKEKSFIIVSHDIPSVVNTCDRVSVLCAGEIIAEGTPDQIRKDEKVIQAYLGV